MNGANTVISVLETQQENSVQSLDLFCHGDPNAVYFVIGASLEKNVENKNRDPIASNIYKTKFTSNFRGFGMMRKNKKSTCYSKFKIECFYK